MYKIFIINLKKDTDRRKYIESHLQENNLDYEIIDAVYGKDLTPEELETITDLKLSQKKMGKTISLNEIGCSLSHQKVYKKIINDNLDGAIILEDDIVLSSNFSEIINSISKNKYLLKDNCWVGFGKAYIDIKDKIFNINEYFAIHSSPRTKGAFAYYIDKVAAQNLITYNKKIIYVADWFFGGYLNKINLYNTNYACSIPKPDIKSSIGETRKKDTNIIKAFFTYMRKTYTRAYYYKYNLGVVSGKYKKNKICNDLTNKT